MLTRLFNELLGRRRRAAMPAGGAAGARHSAALEQARGLIAARRLDEAERLLGTIRPEGAELAQLLFLRGELARRRRDHAAALDRYREALLVDFRHADAWFGMGLCSDRTGDAQQAHLCLRTAASLRPQDADILNELGLVEHAMGNLSCAQDTFSQAVNLNPEHPEAWNNLGMIHAARGQLAQARRAFLRAVSARPGFYTARCNLALACQQLERLEDAERHNRVATEALPDRPEAWLGLGGVLQDQGRLGEAQTAFERAVELSGSAADARAALAGVLLRRGDAAGAEREYRRALELEPRDADAGLGLAQLLLAQGRFDEGWDRYEARLRARAWSARHFPFPACDARPVGRRVLAYGEQGIGEEILFAACLPDLLREAAHVGLVCNPRLQSLFGRAFPAVEMLGEAEAMRVGPEAASAPFDCCVPLGSLGRWYRRRRGDYPADGAYLSADPERVARWRQQLGALGAGRAVGLAWRGGRASTGRELRTLRPADLAPLLRLPGLHWISLQSDPAEGELKELSEAAGAPLVHWKDAHADLEETAALLCALDAVVAAASTVTHLGGALGLPVRVLTPAAPSWRYLSEGSRLPWYPSVTLYRQRQGESWEPAVRSVAAGLAQ